MTAARSLKIAVIDDYSDYFRRTAGYAALAAKHEVCIFTDPLRDMATFIERLKPFDAMVATQQRRSITRAMIEALPNLRMISQTGAHSSHTDVAACTERGIVICAGGGGRSHATAELTWGLVLAALRHIPQEAARLKGGAWLSTWGETLRDKTLGIYAFGKIGSIVAGYGRAFGMKVVCWGREGSLAKAREAGFTVAASREAFFAEADVLSLHLPLNDATRGIVTAADLARMKPTALFVNTSRAPIVATGALEAALRAGRPGRAAIDVFEDEPVLGGAHPLLAMDNVLATPHLGYVVDESLESFYKVATEQLIAYGEGKPINVTNPEALARR